MAPPDATRLRILVVDSDAERAQLVRKGLLEAGEHLVTIAAHDHDLLGTLRQSNPDVLIVALDFPDRDTIEQLRVASRESPRPVVVFVDRSDEANMREAILAGVSAYVVDGLSSGRVRSILGVAMARFQAVESLRRELEEARSTLAERKVIERAKGILMEQRKMSEDLAYRTLRKLAMDQGRRLADVAQSVVAIADILKS